MNKKSCVVLLIGFLTLLAGCSSVFNQKPVAQIRYMPLAPLAGQSITFIAWESYDPGGEIVEYVWEFEDVEITGSVVTKTFSTPGLHTVTLSVMDNSGATSSQGLTFDVGCPPLPENPKDPDVQLLVYIDRIGSMVFPYSYDLNTHSLNKGVELGESVWFGIQAIDPDDSDSAIGIRWTNELQPFTKGITNVNAVFQRPDGSRSVHLLELDHPQFEEKLSVIGRYSVCFTVTDNDFRDPGIRSICLTFWVELPPAP